jgi:hypothetical protein
MTTYGSYLALVPNFQIGALSTAYSSAINCPAIVSMYYENFALSSKLSQEPAPPQEASRRTETSRGLGSQSQGKKAVKVKMVGNVEVCLNVDYILSRKPRQGGKKARKKGGRGTSEGPGFHPFLRWLGMEEKVSPLVLDVQVLQGGSQRF